MNQFLSFLGQGGLGPMAQAIMGSPDLATGLANGTNAFRMGTERQQAIEAAERRQIEEAKRQKMLEERERIRWQREDEQAARVERERAAMAAFLQQQQGSAPAPGTEGPPQPMGQDLPAPILTSQIQAIMQQRQQQEADAREAQRWTALAQQQGVPVPPGTPPEAIKFLIEQRVRQQGNQEQNNAQLQLEKQRLAAQEQSGARQAMQRMAFDQFGRMTGQQGGGEAKPPTTQDQISLAGQILSNSMGRIEPQGAWEQAGQMLKSRMPATPITPQTPTNGATPQAAKTPMPMPAEALVAQTKTISAQIAKRLSLPPGVIDQLEAQIASELKSGKGPGQIAQEIMLEARRRGVGR